MAARLPMAAVLTGDRPAAAAAAAAPVLNLTVTIGAKRGIVENDDDKDVDNQKSNKKATNYGYCCTNPHTGRCEPITSANSKNIPTHDRPDKCTVNLKTCQSICRVPKRLPTVLEDLIYQYNPFLVQPAFDVNQRDEKSNRVFGKITVEDALTQQQNSAQLDHELRNWYLFYTRSQGNPKTIIENIKVLLEKLALTVTEKQVNAIVAIRVNGILVLDTKDYETLIKRLPPSANLVYQLVYHSINNDDDQMHSRILHSLNIELPVRAYDAVIEQHKNQLNSHIVETVRQAHRNSYGSINEIQYWEFDWLYFPMGHYWPKNFAIAFFRYALANPHLIVWLWDQLIDIIFGYNVTWEQGVYLLGQLQDLRDREASLSEEKDRDMNSFKASRDSINARRAFLQQQAWKRYDEEINEIEKDWLERLLSEKNLNPQQEKRVQDRITILNALVVSSAEAEASEPKSGGTSRFLLQQLF